MYDTFIVFPVVVSMITIWIYGKDNRCGIYINATSRLETESIPDCHAMTRTVTTGSADLAA